MQFIEVNHRNPFHYNPYERGSYYNWLKQNGTMMNQRTREHKVKFT